MSRLNAFAKTVDAMDIDDNADVALIVHALVPPNCLSVLARNFEAVWTQWVQLLKKTDLSGCQKCSDPRINTALQALNEAMSGREGKRMQLARSGKDLKCRQETE